MIEIYDLETLPLINRQLFSQAYLQERRVENFSYDTIRAEKQIMREWREAYPRLEDDITLWRYIGSCLSTLHLPYTNHKSSFILYTDASKHKPISICLAINDTDLGRTTKGKHHQANLIKYLRDASLRWGIITNGKRWRLCYAEASAPYEVFLEMDLDRLLKKPDLSEYYLFHLLFGPGALTIDPQKPDSDKVEISTGLDRHLKESEKRIETVQRYLRSRVELILQALCLGFVQDEAAGSYTREMLDEIYRNAIYLLYRILFLFYAETRELLPIQDGNYQRISLASIVEEARLQRQVGKEDPDAFSLWKRLTHLFVIVDDGDETVGVRPYNGGLFSDREKPYLKEHKIANVYLASALYELGYMQGKTSVTPIDYSDLSVRHLGTLYEGLLEYRLHLVEHERVVVRDQKNKRTFLPMSMAGTVKRSETTLEVGQVYFADYKGERKSSGSYYTPEDVVQYIVANTVLPVLQERRQSVENFLSQLRDELVVAANKEERIRLERYADEEIRVAVERNLLSLRILDPAMGSAHFLVAAGQVITNFIVETLNLTEWVNDSVNGDPLIWKRRVAERCLYGVDLNPLAYELAKLALWLNSASEGKPLTFLDHHLKIGNSLYGTPLSLLSTLPTTKKASIDDIWETQRQNTFVDALATLGEITSKDSDDIQDVKRKGKAYQEVNDCIQRLRDIANVWLGTLFGLQNGNGKPVTDMEYQSWLAEVTHTYASATWERTVNATTTLRAARDLAGTDNQCFFHWELEFPDAVVDDRCQFDIIITNPPYVGITPNQAILELYKTARSGDIYAWMFEKTLDVRSKTGSIGLVIPLSLMFGRSFKSLRHLLLSNNLNLSLAAFDNIPSVLFNKGNTGENWQRATILIARASSELFTVKTTDLLRWWSSERDLLFKQLHFTDVTEFCSELSFPRIGNYILAKFWSRFRVMERTLSDICLEMFSETRRPDPGSIFLTVPRATRYFISATPGLMDRNKVLSFSFRTEDELNLARVLLNSNIFYWYWRVFGDGFCLGTELVGSFPIPNRFDSGYINLAEQLNTIQDECITFGKIRGKNIPSYNFNKRMDVLIEIDNWIVNQIAPDLNLPKDSFAQYKSNSFLRPLDLSRVIQAEAEEILQWK